MATIIENLKSKISQGAVVGSPFNLRGVAPNFNRDRIDSLVELGAVTKDDNIYDIGHLVYCAENENIYIFRGHTGGTNYIGQFELFGSGSGSGNGALFEYKGNITGLTQADNEGAVEGWVYRVDTEVIVIPALNSATGQEVSAHTGDVIVCVDKNSSTGQLTWSIIENTLDQAGLIKKDDNASYHEGDIAVYSNSSGDKIKSTGIKAEDIVSVEKNYVTDSTARGTQLYGNTPNTNVPILNDKGNLVDSQVSIDVLRKLQKELGGTEIVETPNDPVKGTLADIIKSYRDNNYKLGSSYDTISATTEEQFISDIQGIFSANTNEVGFILPIVALKNENAQTEEDKYIFEDYLQEGRTQMYVEGIVRKDGLDNNGNICFHVHFLTEKWIIDYWYKGSEAESLLYFEAFGTKETNQPSNGN